MGQTLQAQCRQLPQEGRVIAASSAAAVDRACGSGARRSFDTDTRQPRSPLVSRRFEKHTARYSPRCHLMYSAVIASEIVSVAVRRNRRAHASIMLTDVAM